MSPSLVVDDDAASARRAARSPSGMGLSSLGGSVPEALTLLRQQPWRCFLLDLEAARRGGLKLLGEVKSLYPEPAWGDDAVCHGRTAVERCALGPATI